MEHRNYVIIDELLIDSIKDGDLEAVIYSIEHGAHINSYYDPLAIAIMNKHTDIVEYLINKGANYKIILGSILGIYYDADVETIIYAISFYSPTMGNVFQSIQSNIVSYISRKGINNCLTLIDILRTYGVDVFDLIEHEY